MFPRPNWARRKYFPLFFVVYFRKKSWEREGEAERKQSKGDRTSKALREIPINPKKKRNNHQEAMIVMFSKREQFHLTGWNVWLCHSSIITFGAEAGPALSLPSVKTKWKWTVRREISGFAKHKKPLQGDSHIRHSAAHLARLFCN